MIKDFLTEKEGGRGKGEGERGVHLAEGVDVPLVRYLSSSSLGVLCVIFLDDSSQILDLLHTLPH
jgi:hypothetical protein